MSDQPKIPVLSVTELTSEIRLRLANEFSNIYVSGEVSGLTKPRSGHLYFTLKDKTAQISAIIWRTTAEWMKFEIENGMQLICNGEIDVYPDRGNYQIIVRSAQPTGEGPLQLAFRQLQAKLESEGLFDQENKKQLPKFPRHVAVITSPSGAAVRDFLQVLNRRWSNLNVTNMPVKVQGPGSANQLAYAVRALSRLASPPDVAVVTRGGGSIEDLWSFNEEAVVRAIHACPIPIVSGVGHEIDVTLSDLAADVRALTPSEAAEILVPDQNEIGQMIQSLQNRMKLAIHSKYQFAKQQLDLLAQKPVLSRPLDRLHQHSMELDQLEGLMARAVKEKLTNANHQLKEAAAKLESINPLSVLARGYSVTTNQDGKVLTDCKQVSVGDTITTRLSNGAVSSKVDSTSL